MIVFEKTELTNATHGLCIYCWLLFFKNDNLKYTVTSQRIFFNSFSLFYIFSSFSFLLSLFKLSCTKKHHVYHLYCITCTLLFCYVMYYIVSEICMGGFFLEDSFYCYSQQVTSAIAHKSLISYNLWKEHQKRRTFNTITPDVTRNQIKKYEMQLSF